MSQVQNVTYVSGRMDALVRTAVMGLAVATDVLVPDHEL
jgi:hypothetical protein